MSLSTKTLSLSEDKRETTILFDESNKTKHELISPKVKLKNNINSTSSSQTTISTSPYIPEFGPEGPYFSEFIVSNLFGLLNVFPYSFYSYEMGNLY